MGGGADAPGGGRDAPGGGPDAPGGGPTGGPRSSREGEKMGGGGTKAPGGGRAAPPGGGPDAPGGPRLRGRCPGGGRKTGGGLHRRGGAIRSGGGAGRGPKVVAMERMEAQKTSSDLRQRGQKWLDFPRDWDKHSQWKVWEHSVMMVVLPLRGSKQMGHSVSLGQGERLLLLRLVSTASFSSSSSFGGLTT